MGWVNWTFVGKESRSRRRSGARSIWSLILAAIWFWIAEGFWNVRAYAWSFGIFISLFTLIFGFFAILGSTTFEEEFVPMFLAFLIFFYLNYPGVQQHFVEHEMSLLTPEQRAAMEQVQAANAAAARAMATPAAPATGAAAPTSTPPPPPPPAAAVGRDAPANPSPPDHRSGDGLRSRDRSAPSGSVSSCHGAGSVRLGSSTARRARSRAAVTGRPSSTEARRCPAPSGTRFAGAWRRRRCAGASSSIAASAASARRRGRPTPRGSRSPRTPGSSGRTARGAPVPRRSGRHRTGPCARRRSSRGADAGSTLSPIQATGPG